MREASTPFPEIRRSATLARFWHDQGVFGLLTVVAGVANYFFSVALAHDLGPRRFGLVATLLNVVAVLLIPLPVAALVYTRIGRREESRLEPLLLWGLGLVLFAVPLLLHRELDALFGLSLPEIAAFTVAVVPSFAYAANLGALQRSRRYLAVGALGAATAFLNLAAVLVGLTAFGAAAGTLGILLSLVAWIVWGTSRLLSGRLPPGEPTPASRVLLGTAFAGALYTLYSLTDSLVARHALSASAAGRYIGISTIGSALSYFSGPFGTVMLTAALEEPEAARSFLRRSLVLYAVTSCGGELLFLVATRPLVTAVLGRAFLAASRLLPPYGLAMVALGLVNILLLFAVAEGLWPLLALAAAGYAAWLTALLSAHTLWALTDRTLAVLGATALAMVLGLVPLLRRPRAVGAHGALR
jgi:O-antigen/teichoic acid export membrane protein